MTVAHRLLVNPWGFPQPINESAVKNLIMDWWTSKSREPQVEGTREDIQESCGEFRSVRLIGLVEGLQRG